MARKSRQQSVVGWYQPHVQPAWTGEVVNLATGELKPDPAAVSMTKQSFKEECDINTIVRRFEATGIIDHVANAQRQGLYLDLPSGLDLQSGLDMINQAEAAFMALPAEVRSAYDNDPVQFVEAFRNPSAAQQEQFIKLGLATDKRGNAVEEASVAPQETSSKAT